MARFIAACLALLFSTASTAGAQLLVTEPPDLSNDVTTPSAFTLGGGTNRLSGSVATPGDRQDNFTVTVPAGASLTSVALTLDTHGGFVGSVTWNLSEVRSASGNFTTGLPAGPGTYYVQVITDFSVGNTWAVAMTVTGIAPTAVCGNGILEGDEACEDGNTTACDGCSPTCVPSLDGCLIGGECLGEGTASPTSACLVCRRATSRTTFTALPPGTSCADTLFCNGAEMCDGSGVCLGGFPACDDTYACTTDSCDEATDSCSTEVTEGCLIDFLCVEEGAADPGGDCARCVGESSRTEYTLVDSGTACDDGAFCTEGDVCNAAGACVGAAMSCDDGDGCTLDSCDEAAMACDNEPTDCFDAAMGDDAGATDAGATDAGSSDSGIAADGGIRDAGRLDGGGSDAGTGSVAGGCGCRAGGERASAGWLLSALGLGLVLLRRRR